MIRPALLLAVVLGALAGCTPPADPEDASPGPPKVAFEGEADPQLAGTWETTNRSSVVTLKADGTLELASTYPTPKGPQTSKKQGKWLVKDGKLRLRYGLEDGTEETVAYDLKRDGNRMTLSTKVPKLATDYIRKPR